MDQTPLILVVDDQPGVRRLIEEVFKGVGYRVSVAGNGQEAVALATVEPPSVAILDVRMPVMDGIEALRALRGVYPNLPVIMMTAVGDNERVQEATVSGAFQCISKPFDIFQLRRVVEDALQEGKSE